MTGTQARGALIIVALAAVAVFAVLLIMDRGEDNGGGPETTDFAEFSERIDQAIKDGDVSFFTNRVQGLPQVCTEADVAGSTGPNAPPAPVCTEVGIEYEAISIINYGRAGVIVTRGTLIEDIRQYFADAIHEAEDTLGSGEVQLWATAVPIVGGLPEEGVYSAILTSMQDFAGSTTARRAMRGYDFTYIDGRWVIQSETAATFPLASDLLSASSAVPLYEEWERY